MFNCYYFLYYIEWIQNTQYQRLIKELITCVATNCKTNTKEDFSTLINLLKLTILSQISKSKSINPSQSSITYYSQFLLDTFSMCLSNNPKYPIEGN